MFGFRKDDRYTSIAIYAFIVLALLMLGVVFCINIPYLFTQFMVLVRVLRPVTFALAFAYICNPIVRYTEAKLKKKQKMRERPHLSRSLAITATYIFLLAIIAVLLFMIVPQVAYNYRDFSSNVVRYVNIMVERINAWLQEIGLVDADQNGLYSLFNLNDINAAISSLFGWLTAQLGALSLALLETTGVVAIGLILSVYILYNKEQLLLFCKRLMLALFPRRAYLATAEAMRFADRAFGQFIIGKLIDSFIVGVITFIVLAIVQMPYYPLISAIVCVTSIIPAFGYVIGAIPSLLIIFVKDPLMAIWFLVILVIIQQVDGNIIGPKIVGSATGLASVWVITAIMLMGGYFGPIGWFIGVPLFSVLYRLLGDLVNRRLQKKHKTTALSYYETTTIARTLTDPQAAPTEEAPATDAATEPSKEAEHEKMDE